jgi:hypothetical protein
MNSNIPWPSEARLIAPAGICIVRTPGVITGDCVKWQIVFLGAVDVVVGVAVAVDHTMLSFAFTMRLAT